LISLLLAVLKDFFDEEVKDGVRGVELNDLSDLLFA